MKTIFLSIPACCFVFLLLAANSQAQNNLTAGSIGFISYQSDKDFFNRDNFGASGNDFTDRFSIVIQNQTGLAANTVIYFTDNGWNASTGNFISGLSEGFIKWTVPAGGYPFGTKIYFISKYIDPVTSWGAYVDDRGTKPAGIVTTVSGNNYMELSTGGDQVLAYQTGPTRGPATAYNDINRRFLSGFNMYNGNGDWDGNNPAGGHQSSVPPGLTTGVTAYSPGNWDNAQKFTINTISGCQSTLAAQLYSNVDADWEFTNTVSYFFGNSLSYSLTPGAAITAQPSDAIRCQGITTASFSATADYATSYQWQQSADSAFTSPINLTNTGVFSGTTTNTLNISNNETLNGQYFRVIANGARCGPTTSEGATLSLSPVIMPIATTSTTQDATDNNFIYATTNCELIARVQPAGSSPIAGNVTSNVWIENPVPTYTGQPFVARHFEIMPVSNAAAATATINLYFTQAEFDAFNAAPRSMLKLPTGPADAAGKSNLRIGSYQGYSNDGSGLPGSYSGNVAIIVPKNVTWDPAASNWIVSFDATGFGGFIVQTSATVLPVNLLAFNGRLVNADTYLQWQTTSETDNDYFEIERSFDGQTFTAIGRVTGKNGTTTQTYNWLDAGAAKLNSKLYYRLKIVSTGGKADYSTVVIISVNTTGSPVASVTPNPFTSQVNINLQLPAAAPLTFTLTDVTGKKLKIENVNAAKGFSTISLSGLGNLMQGMYLLSVQYNGQTYTYKLVK